MIPKTIHYCWVGGGQKPEIVEKCVDSWRKYLPDYDMVEWNESNFDIESNLYIKQAYEAKRYAFVSDYIRLYALYNYGGVYLDTDVEVLKPLDTLLQYDAFSGFDDTNDIAMGVIGSIKGQGTVKRCLDCYQKRSFLKPDGSCDLTTIVKTMTHILVDNGLVRNNSEQEVAGFHLFPADFFYPRGFKHKRTKITQNSYTIHYYMDSWNTKSERIKNRIHMTVVDNLKKVIGANNFMWLKKRLNIGETNEI